MNLKTTNSFILVSFLFFSFIVVGQECDCLKNVNALQQKIEENQASYRHQVIENNRIDEYLSFKKDVNAKAATLSTKKDCIGLIANYLSFFRDEHSFIAYTENYVPEKNRVVKSASKKPSSIDGIWYFQDGSFSINISQTQTNLGEWIAVMHEDKSKKWKKGQLKIEFFKENTGKIRCIYWKQNLIPKAHDVRFTDSTLKIGRSLTFYRKKQDLNPSNSNSLVFKSLTTETNYLSIPSFDLSYKHQIDSLIAANRNELVSTKNLIIDIRNNGGGGFGAFESILPFVLDNPLVESPYYGSVWVSEDNYRFYDSTKYDYAETKQDSIDELEYIHFLNENRGKFTPVETSVDTVTLVENYPLNVGILFNKNSASTAEGFILQCATSKKVKTFGEHSAGMVSYGDWMPFELPDLGIWIAITTKKSVFKNNEDFESIGIAPDVDLTHSPENDWLEIVIDELEK